MVQVFQNRPQLSIHKLQPVADGEVDVTDFLPASKRDRDEMFAELEGWIRGFSNPFLKTLLESIFAEESVARRFRTAPAAKTVHHNWIGGLLEHVLSLLKLAGFTASHYADIDRDLLLSGVILHDIGKISELTYVRSLGYSDEGQLLGHITIGVQMVDQKIQNIPGFPPKLRELLLHMILSHHGMLEYGSPKLPVFQEAMLLHLLDNMDSKMETMRASVERDKLIEGNWTSYSSALERSVLKKKRYLDPAPPPPAITPAKVHKKPEPPESPFAAKLSQALRDDS
jgi:3'-5' exoribonuclease